MDTVRLLGVEGRGRLLILCGGEDYDAAGIQSVYEVPQVRLDSPDGRGKIVGDKQRPRHAAYCTSPGAGGGVRPPSSGRCP